MPFFLVPSIVNAQLLNQLRHGILNRYSRYSTRTRLPVATQLQVRDRSLCVWKPSTHWNTGGVSYTVQSGITVVGNLRTRAVDNVFVVVSCRGEKLSFFAINRTFDYPFPVPLRVRTVYIRFCHCCVVSLVANPPVHWAGDPAIVETTTKTVRLCLWIVPWRWVDYCFVCCCWATPIFAVR